jgi:hypothetical protein
VVGTSITINSRGLEGPARPAGRRFKRAVGIAIGMLALGASAALVVGLFENQALTSGARNSAKTAMPGDLFAPPAPPKPHIVVRYMAPRPASSAPAAAVPMASPTSSPRHHPSPSPSPSGGGDD